MTVSIQHQPSAKNSQHQQYLVIGQGAIGSAVSNQLALAGCLVTGLARGQRADYGLSEQVGFMQADATQLTAEQVQSFSHICIIVTPDEYSETGYQNSYLAIAQHLAALSGRLCQLTQLLFISSTGVYGQDEGQWLDEFSQPQLPKRASSRVILQAEQVLQAAFTDRCVIIRPSGIYGVTRRMRINNVLAGKSPASGGQWSNRIMDTDLVTIICQVLQSNAPKPIYIASDYAPVSSADLDAWLRQQLGVVADTAESSDGDEHSERQDRSEATDSPIEAQATAMSGKRLHSNIPLAWLEYPDWQTGYRAILAHHSA